MDLVSSIRKSGSRGGVNFSWDDVASSQHRENYLGHSLKAPVGRWQQGKDLSWYAKGDATGGDDNETVEEKAARERREEIKRIKEAEEDAMAKALGLPVAPRNATGANAVGVSRERDLGGAAEEEAPKAPSIQPQRPDRSSRRERDDAGERRHRRRHRDRSRSRSRDRRKDRERSPRRRDHRDERESHGSRDDGRDRRRRRSRSRDDRDRRHGDGRRRERDYDHSERKREDRTSDRR